MPRCTSHVVVVAVVVAAGVVALFLGPACVFDAKLPAGAKISCHADDDCGDGELCSQALGDLCVAKAVAENSAPSLDDVVVDPLHAANAGTPIRVSFHATEPLGTDPVAELDTGHGAKRALTLVEGGSAGASPRGADRFTLAYTPDGSEAEGSRTVVIHLVDAGGVTGDGFVNVSLDFSAPRIAHADVDKSLVTVDDTVVARLTYQDPDDVVTANVTLVPVDGVGPALAMIPGDDDPLGLFTYTLIGVGSEREGAYTLIVDAADAAGNAVADLALEDVGARPVVIDFTPPSVDPEDVDVGPSVVVPGQTVRVFFKTDAAVQPDVLIDNDGGPLHIEPALPYTEVSHTQGDAAREILVAVGAGAEDGDYVVSFGPLVDVAGNVLASQELGAFRVDGGKPAVADGQVIGAAGQHLGAHGTLNHDGSITVELVMSKPLLSTENADGALVPVLAAFLGGAPMTYVDDAALQAQLPANTYRFTIDGSEIDADDDELPVTVDATDSLGNRATGIDGLVSVEVDTVAPSILAVVPSTTRAPQGTRLFLFVAFSEPLAASPAFAWNAVGAALFGGAAPTSDASGLSYTFAGDVGADTPEGDAVLVGVTGAGDAFGNVFDDSEELIRVELAPKECLEGAHFGRVADVDGRAPCVPAATCAVDHHFGGAHDTDGAGGAGASLASFACVDNDRCSTDFHFGTTTDLGGAIGHECVPSGTCSINFHFGGARAGAPIDDECVEHTTCSAGFHGGGHVDAGGDSICVPFGACESDRHLGVPFGVDGSGPCVAPNECAQGFQLGGFFDHDNTAVGAACVPTGTCSVGFHDSNNTAADGVSCLPMLACAPGFQVGQDPRVCGPSNTCLCTTAGACSRGATPVDELGNTLGTAESFQLGTNAVDVTTEPGVDADGLPITVEVKHADCVLKGTCDASRGFHEDDGVLDSQSGNAQCVPMAVCAAGFHNGEEEPACALDGSCTCVKNFFCADGFHNGHPALPGDGHVACVPDGACLDDAKDNGANKCVDLTDECADGFHDGGVDDDGKPSCVVRGNCGAGSKNNGVGECVAVGAPCFTDYRDDGTGKCVDVAFPCVEGFHDDGSGFPFLAAGACIADGFGCATGAHDGGDGDCVASDECAAGFALGGNGVCGDGCPSGEHDDGTGLPGHCLADGDGCAAPGYALRHDVCRPATPSFTSPVFANTCDDETTGLVGSDGAPVTSVLNASTFDAVTEALECRTATAATVAATDFASCGVQNAIDPADLVSGAFHVTEVRVRRDFADGRSAFSAPVAATFFSHESLGSGVDTVSCCPAAGGISDDDWFAAAQATMRAITRRDSAPDRQRIRAVTPTARRV